MSSCSASWILAPALPSSTEYAKMAKAYECAFQFFGKRKNAFEQSHLTAIVTLIRKYSSIQRSPRVFVHPQLLCHMLLYAPENFHVECIRAIRSVWDCLLPSDQEALLSSMIDYSFSHPATLLDGQCLEAVFQLLSVGDNSWPWFPQSEKYCIQQCLSHSFFHPALFSLHSE